MTEIPVLHTERMVMRGPQASDFDAYAAFYASDRTRHIGGPKTRAQAWRLFAADAGHWLLKGFGWWVLETEGRVLGTVGLHHPPEHADPEIGWNIYEGSDGKGYAHEAAQAALRWAVTALQPARIVSYIDTGNTASIRLAERLGATRAAMRAEHDPQAFVYVHDLDRAAT